MASLTWQGVLARRLRRQQLVQVAPATRLVEVVGAIGGLHAQVPASAELSLGLRVAGTERGTLHDELVVRRGLVKTYGPRGTIHVLPSRELALWMAGLRGAGKLDRDTRRPCPTPGQLERLVDAIGDALDGRCLTRAELGEEVIRRAGPTAAAPALPAFGGSWANWEMALGPAAHAGRLCFGPPRRNRVTFVRPDQWLGPQPEIDEPEALASLVRRYLQAYGPAPVSGLAAWLAIEAGAAARAIALLGREVSEVDVEGVHVRVLARDRDLDEPAQDLPPRLLPAFDPYVVGSQPRDRLVPAPVLARLARRPGPPRWARSPRQFLTGPLPVLILDGAVAGVWERRRSGRSAVIRIDAALRLRTAARRALAGEVDRIAALQGVTTTVEYGPLTIRPHL